MSQFHSDKRLKVNPLGVEDTGNKKSRSFRVNNTEKSDKRISTRIFACEPNNESSETLSDVSGKLRMSSDSVDECKEDNTSNTLLIPPAQNICIEPMTDVNLVAAKKRRLFDDFEETYAKHKLEINLWQSREEQLRKDSMDKHPNSLNREIKKYEKSTFYFIRQQELAINTNIFTIF